MTIGIAWATTQRIFVPRADMALVQAVPEIRELDVDAFRKDLRSLEASVEGMPWQPTHRHVTETTLSGVVYARFVAILPPYQVEFEDGQYTVRAVGANHNIADVKVTNQVSLITQNSAGLIETQVTAQTAAILAEVLRLRKIDYNRLEVDLAAQQLVLYDDDGVTVHQRWDVYTAGGEPVRTTAGVQTRRGPPQL